MELDYVAGLFDGEGSVTFSLSLRNDHGRKCIRFYTWIVISLSYEDGRALLGKVEEYLNRYGIKSFHYPVEINRKGRSYGNATTWKIANQKSILKFIELMKDRSILKTAKLCCLEQIILEHQKDRLKLQHRSYSKEHYSHYRKLAVIWDDGFVLSGKSRRKISMLQKLDNIWNELGLPR